MANNLPDGRDPRDGEEPFTSACERLVKGYSRSEAVAVARALDGVEREQGFLRPEALLQRTLIRRVHGV
jgi:hypothetical protein